MNPQAVEVGGVMLESPTKSLVTIPVQQENKVSPAKNYRIPRRLTGRQIQAATLLAEDRLSDAKIAEHVGVSASALAKWKNDELFTGEIERQLEIFRKKVANSGIANLVKRVESRNDLHRRCEVFISQRAQDPLMESVPGGKTGLVTREAIFYEGGEIGYEYKLDGAVIATMEQLKQAQAKDLGQVDNGGTNVGVAITVRIDAADADL